MNNAAAVVVARPSDTTVPCFKCYGARRFARFSHIANGDCFTCGGSGTVEIKTWSKGLRVHRENGGRVSVSFVISDEGHELLIVGPADGPAAGMVNAPRALTLRLIKDSLDVVAADDTRSVLSVALRLASLGDARAEDRACAYVGRRGEELRAALRGAHGAVAEARRLFAANGR